MFKLKNLTLILLVAVVSISCGTDGLDDVNQSKQLSFVNTDALSGADYVTAGNQYTFTLKVDGGRASNVNLTSFTKGGKWLNAEVVNNGKAIELSGTPSATDANTEYSFNISAIEASDKNVNTTFTVYVDN